MDRDLAYLDELITAGEAFSYRRARRHDETEPTFELSKDSWTEWLTKAEMAVKTFAPPQSEALEHIREAKHLEIVGEILDDFYRSRELALSALRICARHLRQPGPVERPKPEPVTAPAQEIEQSVTFWDHYGKPIIIGVAATVIGGLLLALLL